MNGINPKWIMWLGLLVTIEQAIGHGTVSLTNLIPAAWAPYVTSWCNFGAFVGTSIMTYQAAVSSPIPGPLVNTALAPAAKPLIIIALLMFGLFGLTDPAAARPLNLLKPATLKSSPSDSLTKMMSDLSKVTQDVVGGVVADIQAADADAGALTNASDPSSFRDPIAHACYPAEVKFLQSLPVATPPTGKYVLVQLFQKKRDFVIQLQAGLPAYLKLGCSALLGDEIQIFTKSLALVGVTVAANGLLPGVGALALPAL